MRTALCLGLLGLFTVPALGQTISEIRTEESGADINEYIELAGSGSLDGYSYIVIGDGDTFPPTQNGVIESVVDLTGSTIGASGFFVIAEKTYTLGTPDLVATLNFEGSDNVTHLLVANFTGAFGDDLDTNDDGVLDVTPWSMVADSVAILRNANPDGTSDDFYYSDNTVGPDGGFVPGHVWTCNDTGEWRVGNFTVGIDDTPGAANADCGGGGGGGGVAVINEIRIDQTSTDNDEYFELMGDAGTSLHDLTYIVIGDGSTGSGTIEAVVPLENMTIGSSGYFLAVESSFTLGAPADLVTSLNFENADNVTHMLVRDFTGANADDLDTDDDGTLDTTPWSEVVDCIALIATFTGSEQIYCDNTLGPDGSYVPSHSYRCFPDGVWTIGSFFPSDLLDTPGAENLPCPSVLCGGEEPRNCFEVRAEAGCSDGSCCELVNAVDSSCGETEWDQGCVDLAITLCLGPADNAPDLRLSEVRMKQGGTDNDEFLEITGQAGTELDGVSLLVIGGQGEDNNGHIEAAVNLSGYTIGASGFFVAAEDTFTLGTPDAVMNLEFNDSYNKTLLLVYNFMGTVQGDLDAGDDCALDSSPWEVEIDGVSWVSTFDTNCTYASAIAGPDGDYSPGHAYLCDAATDTWGVGTFYTSDSGAVDSPGAPNPTDCDIADCPAFEEHAIAYPCSYILNSLRPSCCQTWDSSCQEIVNSFCNFGASAPADLALHELRTDQVGDDNDEYVEIFGAPGTSLDGYSIVVIGDGAGGSGTIETFAPLTYAATNAEGLAVLADATTYTLGTPDATWGFDFENSDNLTIMIVYGFSATEADMDIDVDDDGVLDLEPWIEVVDCISLIHTDPAKAGEQVYCTTQIGPTKEGYAPTHAYFDCAAGAWMLGLFDPVGETDTPGVLNNGCGGTPCPADLNNDGEVDGGDLTMLLGGWATANGDIDGDGNTDGADLTMLLGAWGPC